MDAILRGAIIYLFLCVESRFLFVVSYLFFILYAECKNDVFIGSDRVRFLLFISYLKNAERSRKSTLSAHPG